MPSSITRRLRPVGQPTRGKTALNRLRQIDSYVALALPHVLTAGTPLVVDVGFGAYPWTTLEMRERWLPLNPRLRVIGTEIDPERVAAALPYRVEGDPPPIDFRLAGFNLADSLNGERARLIRCYNVLRQYDESAVDGALSAMAQALEPGGLLIEGTSNPTGRMVAFDLYTKTHDDGLIHRALVFGTNFRDGIEPVDFQTILPKRLIHHMRDPILAAFFRAWEQANTLVRGTGQIGRRRSWFAAAHLLRARFGYRVDLRERLLRRGFLTLFDRLV